MHRHFIIRIDQQSLHHLTHQREVGSESQYWMSKLIGFDYEIQFKPGYANCVDALSCKTVGSVELGALISTHGVVWTDLEKEIERDPLLSKIKQDLQGKVTNHLHFSLVDNKLLFKGSYVIPDSSAFVSILMQEYHDSPCWEPQNLTQVSCRLVLEGNAESCGSICATLWCMSTTKSFPTKPRGLIAWISSKVKRGEHYSGGGGSFIKICPFC